MFKPVIPVIIATIRISAPEFLRTEILFKSYWTEQDQNLGLVFPSAPVNGAVWGLWSLLFAIVIFVMAKRFSLLKTALLAWFTGFVMMWVAIGNLAVLPFTLFYIAVP